MEFYLTNSAGEANLLYGVQRAESHDPPRQGFDRTQTANSNNTNILTEAYFGQTVTIFQQNKS